MKRFVLLISIFLLLLMIPSQLFAIQFQMTDEKGFYYYICEGQRIPVRIKIVDKNKYKVLSRYHGYIVHAESEYKAAQQVCGETTEKVKKAN